MNSGTQETSPFKINLTHDMGKINDAIGFFPKAWCTTKKYSVNNVLSIAAVNTWLQFSLAYVAAVIITSNDVSFITNILNSQAMPAYAFASVILGVVLLTSLAIKHVYKQEIKDERLKDGKSTIDRKIRSGHSDGINETAQNALIIEIIPDLGSLVDKKQSFSIVLPISEKQGKILENKRQENRNKIFLLTVPYVLSGLIVVGALAKFGFAHIRGWEEWTFIAVVGIVAIAGTYITLNKLRNNEVDNNHNIVKKFNNLDILLPCRKGMVVSVMENKFESKEENYLQSQALRLLDNSLLKSVNAKVREVLDDVGENIKRNVDGARKGIEESVQEKLNTIDVNGTTGAVKNAAVAVTNATNKFNPGTWFSWWSQSNTQLQEATNNGQRQAIASGGCSSTSENGDNAANLLENKVKEQHKRVRDLELQKKSSELTQREKDLEKELAEQEKTKGKQEKINEWKEKINGKPSEFLYHLLESIKLEGKSDQKEKVSEATLSNFNNKIIIHWKDGSQTTCHIKKQGDFPSTTVDFADQNIHAAFAVACAG